MNLPGPVVKYLTANLSQALRPVCFLVDSNYRVIDFWGDCSWCKLEAVQNGTDMVAVAPYVFELFGLKPNVVEFVEVTKGVVAHVHTLPEGDHHYLILLDAHNDHQAIQLRQQSINEHRLLHASQQRLIDRQRELISELVEAKAELDHRRKEAERGSANRSEFIAMMSHEFRTPLAAIVNYADLASESNANKKIVNKSLATIKRSARHLTELIEAVLDEARLDAGQLDLMETDFDLHQLVDDLTCMMAPLAADKELSFVCQIDPTVPRLVRADEVRLRQILINLLGNAIKFTQTGGIQMVVTYADNQLVLSVADTGPGISAANQEKVFRAFERSGAEKAAGAGLGLTISLQLAQLMEGEITLDSKPGQGCTVAVHLPIAAGQTKSANLFAMPPQDSQASKPVSVLICDDDEDMLALVEHYFHRAGYGLIVTTNGPDALQKCLDYEPDIVLMDCRLQGMSGPEVAAQLRQRGFTKPIIALTASKLSDKDQAPFTTYYRKPAAMQDLLAEVKTLTH